MAAYAYFTNFSTAIQFNYLVATVTAVADFCVCLFVTVTQAGVIALPEVGL